MPDSDQSLPFDPERLLNWMDQQALGNGELKSFTPLTGGTQNILLKFSRSGRDYVLRRPPIHLRPSSNETMRREARVLAALADTDVPHAGLIAACADEEVLGAAFYLMEPVDGFNAAKGLPELHTGSPELRHEMGLNLVDAIAALGALDYRAIGLEDFGNTEKYLARQADRWLSQLQGYQSYSDWPGVDSLPHVQTVVSWLQDNQPQSFQPGLVHGDCHLANMMFDRTSARLLAVVDWELATIGDPLLDLGTLISSWPGDDGYALFPVEPWEGFPSVDEIISRYAEQSGRDLEGLSWYIILACLRGAVICEGTYARACAGKVPGALGEYMHEHAINLMTRASRYIDAPLTVS